MPMPGGYIDFQHWPPRASPPPFPRAPPVTQSSHWHVVGPAPAVYALLVIGRTASIADAALPAMLMFPACHHLVGKGQERHMSSRVQKSWVLIRCVTVCWPTQMIPYTRCPASSRLPLSSRQSDLVKDFLVRGYSD